MNDRDKQVEREVRRLLRQYGSPDQARLRYEEECVTIREGSVEEDVWSMLCAQAPADEGR